MEIAAGHRLARFARPDNFRIHEPLSVGIRIALAVLWLWVPGTAQAGAAPLFADDAPFRAVLTAPISQAFAQKNQHSRLYLPAQWSYVDDAGETVRLDVSIRTRGDFRRTFCELAPLQLNFRKSQVGGTLFAGQNKLKLVAPCMHWPEYQRFVLLEYLAYRTLEMLTDYSFRTRLIRLSYIDSDEKLEPWTAIAFVIEDDADLARRLGLQKTDLVSVGFLDLDHEQAALVELFQMLIGNNDFSLLQADDGESCCHNTEILALNDASPKIPVPFDFDFSGLVNAPYAAPPEHLPISEVRQRYYTGLCHPPGVLDAAVAKVRSKRKEIRSLFRNFGELTAKDRRRAELYVEGFFRILDNPRRVEREIYARCRGEHLLENPGPVDEGRR